MYARDRRLIGVWPTNDGLVMTYVAAPADEFRGFRGDVERHVLASLDLAGDLGERVRAGGRAERFYGTADLAGFFRKPYGAGWALVGDAGLVMDPVTGQGIGHAFRDAELLADAITDGLDGRTALDAALAEYERRRNAASLPIYEFTAELASFGPPKVEERVLFEALAANQAETARFLLVLTGALPFEEYFTPKNLLGIIGVRGLARVALGKLRSAIAGEPLVPPRAPSFRAVPPVPTVAQPAARPPGLT